MLAVWTKSILLKDEVVALNVSPDLIKLVPEMEPVLASYMKAKTARERNDSAIYAILKFPDLTPLVTSGVPTFTTAEALDYYFDNSWWCPPAETEYDTEGNEIPKNVSPPAFLSAEALTVARKERSKLIALGEGRSFLGRQVLEWAKRSPTDQRLPEALFIAIRANENYMYGCARGDSDEDTLKKLTEILNQQYPQSPWTAKLAAEP
jgi:hypothetical protein